MLKIVEICNKRNFTNKYYNIKKIRSYYIFRINEEINLTINDNNYYNEKINFFCEEELYNKYIRE
jgi:hypothetical protein